MPEQKKMIRRYEVVLSVIALLIIAYLVVGEYGCFLVNKTETEVIWTDGSSHDNLKAPELKEEELDPDVEIAVKELARIFANKKSQNARQTEGQMRRIGLDADERNYYRELRESYGLKDVNTWFQVLKGAGKTYQTMQEVFDNEQPNDGDDFYQSLEDQFGIPASLSRDFAKQGKEKVSDWALFVEENR